MAGVIGKSIYDESEDSRLSALADRDGNEVIWFDYDPPGRLWKARDGSGRSVEYSYTHNLLTKVKDPLGRETTYEYDSRGRMVKMVDSGGRPTIISYDSYGGVASVVDRFGKGHFFEYDYDEARSESYAQIRTSSGRIEEMWYDRDGETRRVDVNGRTVKRIVKDGRNHIITDEKGNITRKDYDEWDNLTRVVYPDGSEVSFQYDRRFNRVSRIVDLRGHIATFEYDGRGNLVKKVEAVGTDVERTTVFTYDGFGQPLTATIEGEEFTESAASSFTYDENGNLASMTDPEGNTTEFLDYDAMGNLLEMKDPLENLWIFKYDDMGRLIAQTDPLENKTSYEYDDHNNLIKATDPYGKYVTTNYNSDDLPVRLVDQEGKESLNEYDNENRLRKAVDGAGNEILYHYDETQATAVSSHLPVQIDFPTYSRRMYYDELQRLVRTRDVLDVNTAYTRSFAYDKAGNVLTETDEQGKIAEYEYDPLNRLVRITDPPGGVWWSVLTTGGGT